MSFVGKDGVSLVVAEDAILLDISEEKYRNSFALLKQSESNYFSLKKKTIKKQNQNKIPQN